MEYKVGDRVKFADALGKVHEATIVTYSPWNSSAPCYNEAAQIYSAKIDGVDYEKLQKEGYQGFTWIPQSNIIGDSTTDD